jgi:hypothetical protein
MRTIAIFRLALLPTFAWAGTGDPGPRPSLAAHQDERGVRRPALGGAGRSRPAHLAAQGRAAETAIDDEVRSFRCPDDVMQENWRGFGGRASGIRTSSVAANANPAHAAAHSHSFRAARLRSQSTVFIGAISWRAPAEPKPSP